MAAQPVFPWANVAGIDEADVVVIGVPDDSGSYARRKGTAQAPRRIREVASEREVFERGGVRSIALPLGCSTDMRIADRGDVAKGEVRDLVRGIVEKGKIPITMGGDHSITAEILKAIDEIMEVSIVYFDAHPDFICSTREYYGSVVCDISEYDRIDFDSSIELGVRAPEPEELINLRRKHLETLSPYDIEALGLKGVLKRIKQRVKKDVYVSVDMDVVDPAFAPGVSVPVPGGLSSAQALYLVRKISEIGLVGLDVMEVCPPYDVQDVTSHLAARVMMEGICGA